MAGGGRLKGLLDQIERRFELGVQLAHFRQLLVGGFERFVPFRLGFHLRPPDSGNTTGLIKV